jgi:hypothetical protein
MPFEEFLEKLGNMHDCCISNLRIDAEAGSIEFTIDDLYSNFEGLPAYRGPLSGVIILQGVTDIDTDIEEFSERLNVYDIVSREIATHARRINMAFWPSGKLSASYKTVLFPALH